jgi:hypothetical protein
MNRGRLGEPVFTVDDDHVSFIASLRESRELWNVNVAAYCLMPNKMPIMCSIFGRTMERGNTLQRPMKT